jgi:hypothetical protein
MDNPKTTGYSKIQTHPDKEEILQRLLGGDSVRNIESWLKQKYPYAKDKQISFMSLQSYRKTYLNLDNKVIKDLQKERKQLVIAKRQEDRLEMVQQTKAYQTGLANYVQDSLIDYNAEMLKMMQEIGDGIEQLKDINATKSSHLNHQAIATYLNQYKGIIEMHHKLIKDQEKRVGNKLESDYETLNKKMSILIDAVKDAFNQTNPDGLFVFLRLVKEKMQAAGIRE